MFRISYLNIIILGISLVIGKGPTANSQDFDSHINSYSYVNQSQHDNIDDTEKEHVHSHKHSEDGEEHEHSNIGHQEFKVLTTLDSIRLEIKEYKSSQGFRDKNLISNSPLLQVFRPPIV